MLSAINPSNEKPVRQIDALTPAQCDERIQACAHAHTQWSQRSFAERASVLNKVAAQMRENREQLALFMTEEMGKPIKEARAEVDKAAWCAEHYAEHAQSYLQRQEIASDAPLSYVQHLPLGTVLGVLPWNAPFWLAFRFCAPALMAGNTCAMKHDPHVPGCAQAIADCFAKAGAPDNILVNLPLSNNTVEAAIRHPLIRAVSFTGSEKAGAIVASVAASEIKPAVLELGGSDPCIVLADADLDKAADIITLSRIINAGQSCIAAKRILVERAVYPQFCEMLHERLARLKLGDPREEKTDVGPIARKDLRDILARQVQDSIEAGAKCLLGGQKPDSPGYFYPVTLLADVTPEMPVFREETFGPVMVLSVVENDEQALTLANDTPYGLAASVWSERERGETIARQIQAGQVSVNGIVKTDPRLPSGGIKRSGYGRELGPHGIHEFVNAQQVWVGPVKPN